MKNLVCFFFLFFLKYTPFLVNYIFFEKKDNYIVVDCNGNGDFLTIQEAIDASSSFPETRITIYIKSGTYFEKVKIHAWNTNITLIGEDKNNTIITYNDYFNKINKGRNSTFHTATLQIDGIDTQIYNLTIQNSAGDIGQAIALYLNADRIVVMNCNILGNQDTVYVSGESSKNYFNACFIEGTTDFIFGNSTAFFELCDIHSKKNSFITAASTTQNQKYGLVFYKCNLTAETNLDKVYLGRPWRKYAKTVFLECEFGSHILEVGWDNWNKPTNESTVFFAEYNCKGLGNNPTKRVKWSFQLNKSQSKKYDKSIVLNSTTNKNWFFIKSQ